MEAVKVWAFSTCVAVVIGSVVSMIVPSVGKQKIMRIVISAFVLVGMISPALSLIEKSDFSSDALNSIQAQSESDASFKLNEAMLMQLEEASVSALFPIFSQELSDIGITEEFGIKLELTEQKDGIEIEKVNISISDLHMIEKEEIQMHLEQKTGLPIDIDITEGEET